MTRRRPAVAGLFYEADRNRLQEQIRSCFLGKFGPGRLPEKKGKGEGNLLVLVVPHAGYIYSGQAAAHAYLALAEEGLPERIVILGPNHRAVGANVALWSEGEWQTPLGVVSVDSELARRILENSDIIRDDPPAHLLEHSLEVQLPFLQFVFGNEFKFVPIAIQEQTLYIGLNVGNTLAKVLKGERAVVIASTDLTHYEPQAWAMEKDKKVIECIKSLDETGMFLEIARYDITMCGPAGVVAAIVYAKGENAKRVISYQYYTSGDIMGDTMAVVGYASLGIYK